MATGSTRRLVAATVLSWALAACGSSATSPSASGSPGGTATGGTATGSATAGSAGSSGDGTMGSPPGGSGGVGGAGVGGDAAAGAGAAGGAQSLGGTGGSGGSGGAAGDASGGAGGAAGAGNCPPPALICDDFEGYSADATDLSPNWIAYTYSGTVRVDATKRHAGNQSLHLTAEAGMRHYADIMRETRGAQLLPLKHYGRLMVWLTSIPQGAQHWNLNMSSGPMMGDAEELAKFAEGGMFGKLMSNYAQRGRVMQNGVYPLRGIGPEQGDPGVESDCAVAAPNQTIQAGQWVCWEWEFDGTSNSAYLWLDGVAMNEVDAVGHGTQCQGPGYMGQPMTADYPWVAPEFFDKVLIGWEQYQDTPAQEVWIDDVVISTQRVGCPVP